MKHILNPEFQYTPSYATDIRRTFAQRRAQLEFERSAHACQSCGADGFCTAGPTCVATSNPRKRCSHCPWPNGCDVRDCGRRDERETVQ